MGSGLSWGWAQDLAAVWSLRLRLLSLMLTLTTTVVGMIYHDPVPVIDYDPVPEPAAGLTL